MIFKKNVCLQFFDSLTVLFLFNSSAPMKFSLFFSICISADVCEVP